MTIIKVLPHEQKAKSYKQRRHERTKAHFDKINSDRALARDISKAWGRLTKPTESLAEFRRQIQTAADLAARAQLNSSFRQFLNRIAFHA